VLRSLVALDYINCGLTAGGRPSNQQSYAPTVSVNCAGLIRSRQSRQCTRLGLELQSGHVPATIALVQNVNQNDGLGLAGGNPFRPGIMVLVTLGNPREKFWGAILSLSTEGLSLCGVELASFDDLISLVKDGEPFSPGVVFVPMHRVERMELDLPDGSIPSLSQRFASKTGLDPAAVLIRHIAVNPQASGEQK
jgi:hypothetical protein